MEIIYSKYFVKQYKKLPKDIQDKFKKRLDIFQNDNQNSILNIHGLRGMYAGKYSFNVTADYRVIFAYMEEDVAMLIDIGTHSKLYS
jgi:addiction module RelE/StbE family toxin